MAMDFPSPSMRAAGGDLAIQLSPIGLIDISDEEFEVHGKRMARYANQAGFYLGHHWAYKKQAGEPQLVINYTKAISDYLTDFSFTKGVTFKAPRAYQHIVPALLDRIFDTDNNKAKLLWEMGQSGSIFGDVFVKVAYEPAYEDGAGVMQPGRVRLILLNPGHCFPKWHPHDPGRMTEFKLKYKFWDTAPDGTRLTNTYVEIITDTVIREYRNDRLFSERPNPLGCIPVVHIANTISPGSPWGLSDVENVIALNREFNEKSTEISDIINYHSAPITVITGGSPPNLEKGPAKIWGLKNDKARVTNLEGGAAGLEPALEYRQQLKGEMFEVSGVPENALGTSEAISNTSGTAMTLQYGPTIRVHARKIITYSEGLKKICRLALMTIFMAEPDTIMYNPDTDGIMEDEGQEPFVDPRDLGVYQIDCDFNPPLPVDILVKLNEIQLKLELGLESKRGALRDLGEEFPDEKLQELFEEQMEDMKQEAAKTLVRAQVAAVTMAMGVMPEGMDAAPPGEATKNADGTETPAPPPPLAPALDGPIGDAMARIKSDTLNEIVTMAVNPRVPRFRSVDKNYRDNSSSQ